MGSLYTLYDACNKRKEAPKLNPTMTYTDLRSGSLAAFNMGDLVFVSLLSGLPSHNSSYGAHLNRVCKKAGIRHVTMHMLRHTFATKMIEAGVAPYVLQKLLGHTSIQTTINTHYNRRTDWGCNTVSNNLFRCELQKSSILTPAKSWSQNGVSAWYIDAINSDLFLFLRKPVIFAFNIVNIRKSCTFPTQYSTPRFSCQGVSARWARPGLRQRRLGHPGRPDPGPGSMDWEIPASLVPWEHLQKSLPVILCGRWEKYDWLLTQFYSNGKIKDTPEWRNWQTPGT